jgi:hypothetical protein
MAQTITDPNSPFFGQPNPGQFGAGSAEGIEGAVDITSGGMLADLVEGFKSLFARDPTESEIQEMTRQQMYREQNPEPPAQPFFGQ